MLLQLLKFSLIAEKAPLSCAKRCSREGEGGSRELSVSGCCLCALSGWRGVARCSGQEPRQPSSKVNSTASLSSPGLCLFCPLQAPPETCWQAAVWRCAHASQTAWQPLLCLCLCCCCCHVLCWAGQSPCFQQKPHRCACSFPRHAAAGSCGAEAWKIASRDLDSLFQAPRSFTEMWCVLCVRKN